MSVYPLTVGAATRLSASGVAFTVTSSDAEAALIREVAGASALIARGPARVTRAVLEAAPFLRVVAAIGSGTDAIDVRTATERNVVVTSGTGVGRHAVAEWVIAATLLAHRRILAAHRAAAEGTVTWATRVTEYATTQVTGSTIGIVGLGAIGREVARLARAFAMEVGGYDPRPGPPLEGVDRYEDVDGLLARSDTVAVTIPLNDRTRGLIGARQLARLPPNAVLVNASRGGIVIESDLEAALRLGDLAGAVLDVFDPEPPTRSRLAELATVPNLILSPHVAGATVQAVERLEENAVDAVLAVLDGRVPPNVVNPSTAAFQCLVPHAPQPD